MLNVNELPGDEQEVNTLKVRYVISEAIDADERVSQVTDYAVELLDERLSDEGLEANLLSVGVVRADTEHKGMVGYEATVSFIATRV